MDYTISCSALGRENRFLSSPKGRDSFWDQPSLLFGCLFGLKWERRKTDHLLLSSAEVKNGGGGYKSCPPTCLHDEERGKIYLYNFLHIQLPDRYPEVNILECYLLYFISSSKSTIVPHFRPQIISILYQQYSSHSTQFE